MPSLPQTISRKRHIDREGRSLEPLFRRAVLMLLLVVAALALAGVFGQRPSSSAVDTQAARLAVSAPEGLRGGLIYQARLEVDAHRALEKPALVLDPGWFEGLTINSVQPEPAEWQQRDGRNVLRFGPVASGGRLVVRIQYQVNPTALGGRDQFVALEDGGRRLAAVRHSATIFP